MEKNSNRFTPPIFTRRGSSILILAFIALVVIAFLGVSVTKLYNVSFKSLISSETTMQAQHFAKQKMNYLVYKGYGNLAVQGKLAINGSSFKDSVALGNVTTDIDGVSQRLVTVSVYYDDEAVPRSTLQQVFYSNDANLYVRNDSNPNDSISLKYENDKISAKVNGVEKDIGGVPVGTILSWYGRLSDIPSGFVLCNGANGTPDLRDRFLVGAGSSYALGNTGGENQVKLTGTQIGNHYHYWGYHNGNNGGYFLTSAGSFTNAAKESWVRAGKWNGSGGGGYNGWDGGSGTNFYVGQNLVTSNAVATAAQESHENRPPYYAVYYIMRIR